jgi:hypothetical protein
VPPDLRSLVVDLRGLEPLTLPFTPKPPVDCEDYQDESDTVHSRPSSGTTVRLRAGGLRPT